MGISEDVLQYAYLAAIDCVLQRIMPSESQFAEWGVATLKGPFKRLTVNLPSDSYKRFRIIACCVHLMNFRTRTVGLNQIKSTYDCYGTIVQPWVQAMIRETL